MAIRRLRYLVLALPLLCPALALTQKLSNARDHSMPPSGQVTVPAKHGLVFQMKVNGLGPFETVFDTGAVSVVSSTLAKQLGLRKDSESYNFNAIGGSGKVHTAHVDTISIGDLTVRNQTFFVMDIPSGEDIPQMLVGWELLQSFAVRIDFARDELTFVDSNHLTTAAMAKPSPLFLISTGMGRSSMRRLTASRAAFSWILATKRASS